MSIIGPRPERPMFVKQFIEMTPEFEKRMIVKPGLTGWAQVNGGYDLSANKKLVYDLYYIENRGFRLDFEILLRTVKVVLTGEGAR
jgi:lipopolysaccharide/colanic/teichoic acid biosynthesis glycosyltransferase